MKTLKKHGNIPLVTLYCKPLKFLKQFNFNSKKNIILTVD